MSLKPWPKDAVMVVCPAVRDANLSDMVNPRAGSCRDCGAAVLCCSRTYRQAESVAGGLRPVAFFCPRCHRNHDLSGVGITNRPDALLRDILSQSLERN